MLWLFALLKLIAPSIGTILDKFVPDANARLQVKAELLGAIETAVVAKRDVLMTEMRGESWVQRNWRPLCGWAVTSILIFLLLSNYVLRPYVWFFWGVALPDIPIGKDLFELAVFCLGGYIATLDSVERIVRWMRL